MALGILAGLILPCVPVSGDGLILEAIDSGQYDQEGDHSALNSNYICGSLDSASPVEHRNFFVFDLSSVTETVVTGYLEAYTPFDGYMSPDPFETFSLFEFSTDVAILRAGGGRSQD